MENSSETDYHQASCIDVIIDETLREQEHSTVDCSGVGPVGKDSVITVTGTNKSNDFFEEETYEADKSGEQVSLEGGESGEIIDPYGYLNRGDFSSEIYKVELVNLPKRFGIAQLRKKLVFMGLSPCKIKSVDCGHFAFVTFRSEADRQKAFEVLQGHVWKNRPIRVKMAAANADPLMLKRKHKANVGDQPVTKQLKTEEAADKLTLTERLNNTVTPLWTIPYEDQLKTKYSTIREFIKRLGRQIEKNNDTAKTWLSEQRLLNEGLCCKLHPIKPSPVLNGYRNKCEFTVGLSPEGKDNTVGFRLGSYKDGVISVIEPDDCINIPQSMKHVAKLLQTYLQNETTRKAFNPINRQGFWKEVTVRTTASKGVLVIITFHPQNLSQEEIDEEKEHLKIYFESLFCQGEDTVSSLYFQVESDRKEKYEDGVCDHLRGKKFIEEDLLEMKFRISPLAFFQVNSSAAEILYSTLADWCKITPNTVLLDICCGTGTIGLTMAKKVKKVIGIELSHQAVDDAKFNAQANGVENAEFICGKAEDLMPSLMRQIEGQEVVAVVDPPRAGLHSDVIRVIRKSSFVNHLIYVSCKPTAAIQNITDFTRQSSKRVSGIPFRLVQAVPIDLFPHTEHCELVLMFERENQSS